MNVLTKKRILTAAMTAAFALTGTSAAYAQSCTEYSTISYTDLCANTWEEAIGYYAKNNKKFKKLAVSTTSFGKNDTFTRSEAAKLFCEVYGFGSSSNTNWKFTDISSDPNRGYIQKLAEQGVVDGSGTGAFNPNDTLTRIQAAVMIYNRAYKGQTPRGSRFTDLPAWGVNAVEVLYDNCVVSGTSGSTFSPNSPVTRIQLASFMVRQDSLDNSFFCSSKTNYTSCSKYGNWSNKTCSIGTCDVESGGCVECKMDSDCGSGGCYRNECVSCTKDSQCGGGQVCDTSIHECVQCVDDFDCSGAEVCEDNRCVTCRDNEQKCEDGVVSVCRFNMWQMGETCTFGCQNMVSCKECMTDSKRCSDGNLQICKSDGTWDIDVNCAGLGCDAANLKCLECSGDEKLCDGTTMKQCIDGAWRDGGCGSAGCNLTTKECNACKADDLRCITDSVEKCDNAGHWLKEVECNGNGCNTANKTCNSCQLGASRCDGNSLKTCSDGLSEVTISCPLGCDSEKNACKTSSNPADEKCTPGTKRCSASGVPEACSSEGKWITSAICLEGSFCLDGDCVSSSKCTEGTIVCTDDTNYKICSQGKWTTGACDANQVCVSDKCVGGSSDDPGDDQNKCNTGDFECSEDGVWLLECNADGKWEKNDKCDYGCANKVCNECKKDGCDDDTAYKCIDNKKTAAVSCSEMGAKWSCNAGNCVSSKSCKSSEYPKCAVDEKSSYDPHGLLYCEDGELVMKLCDSECDHGVCPGSPENCEEDGMFCRGDDVYECQDGVVSFIKTCKSNDCFKKYGCKGSVDDIADPVKKPVISSSSSCSQHGGQGPFAWLILPLMGLLALRRRRNV